MRGAQPSMRIPNDDKPNVLHWAVAHFTGDLRFIELLLRHPDIDVRLRCFAVLTPQTWMAIQTRTHVVTHGRLLLAVSVCRLMTALRSTPKLRCRLHRTTVSRVSCSCSWRVAPTCTWWTTTTGQLCTKLLNRAIPFFLIFSIAGECRFRRRTSTSAQRCIGQRIITARQVSCGFWSMGLTLWSVMSSRSVPATPCFAGIEKP